MFKYYRNLLLLLVHFWRVYDRLDASAHIFISSSNLLNATIRHEDIKIWYKHELLLINVYCKKSYTNNVSHENKPKNSYCTQGCIIVHFDANQRLLVYKINNNVNMFPWTSCFNRGPSGQEICSSRHYITLHLL